MVFEDFGDNALGFCLYLWLDLSAQNDYRVVITDLRHTIAERFAERDLNIAFPQRDVHLDAADPIPVRLMTGSDRE